MITTLMHPLPTLILSLCLLGTVGANAAGALDVLQRRPAAPKLVLADVYGVTHRLAELRGSVVLVNFWATWCPPCRQEMPGLQRAWEQLKGTDFRILAVATGQNSADIAGFYRSMPAPLTFTLLPDPDSTGWRSWPFHGLPATFIIDKSGHVVDLVEGAREWDSPEMLAVLRRLIAEPFDPSQPQVRVDAGQASGHSTLTLRP
jgi:peroxiredoxin